MEEEKNSRGMLEIKLAGPGGFSMRRIGIKSEKKILRPRYPGPVGVHCSQGSKFEHS